MARDQLKRSIAGRHALAWRMPRFLLALLLLVAAPVQSADDFPRDTVVPRVATLAPAEYQYALYLPAGYDPSRRWPLLIVLDPRGRAEASIAMAVEGARRHGWIVMSAWQSRSDTAESVTLLALQALLDDSSRRFSLDPRRLYLAGMSGTAKSLWTVVPPLRGSLAGLVGCAGGREPGSPPLTTPIPPFFGCTGDHDFNHAEMLALDATLAKAGARHRLQGFAGGHGWPSAGLGEAIDWLQLMAMRDGLAARDADWIAARLAAERAAGEAQADEYRRWLALAPLAGDYAGLAPDDGLAARVEALARSTAVRAARARESELAEDERRYHDVVDAWVGRMRARFPDGRAQDPPTRGESVNVLKVRSLQKLANGGDAMLADSARRRLELAFAAANFYVPAEAEARKLPGHAKAARAVAGAIFPERATAAD